MTRYDIFNGDADGLCALQQLRLSHPEDNELVTGIKRDIKLVEKITPEDGDSLTVLDISFDKNRTAVTRALDAGASVRYFDHHYAGDLPDHPSLEAHINTASNTCTSLIMDAWLEGARALWAITGAFGDNMDSAATARARSTDLNEKQLGTLRELGILLNYNGYGACLDDLHFHPAELYKQIQPFENPLVFMADNDVFGVLQNGYNEDMAQTRKLKPEHENEQTAVYILPAEKWARRISGVFGNQLAKANPDKAHAVLVEHEGNKAFTVSVRAPLNKPQDADTLCRQFDTGGGRKGAAGINRLAADKLQAFINALGKTYP